MHWNLHAIAIYGTLSTFLILSGCLTPPQTPSVAQVLVIASAQTSVSCEACDQATLAVALTQQKNSTDNQAVADAEIVRVNAQATLNSANATLSAAQTQEQNNTNVIAAQIAATAEIVRANAQATLISAGSTQSAALTHDAIRQTQMADLATTGAESLLIQQNKDDLAASTQTAVANNIATQTQASVATAQWYADRARQREEQRLEPIAFLWMWCLPMFIVLFTGLALWGFWRWLKIQQANPRILETPVERLQAPTVEVVHHHDSLPHLESGVVESGYQFTNPDDQMRRWLDEVKRKLQSSDEKDEDDNTNK